MARIIIKQPDPHIYRAEQWNEGPNSDINKYRYGAQGVGNEYGLTEEQKGGGHNLEKISKLVALGNQIAESPAVGALTNLGKAAAARLGQFAQEGGDVAALEAEKERGYAEAEALDAEEAKKAEIAKSKVLGDVEYAKMEERRQFADSFPKIAESDPAKAVLAIEAAQKKGIITSEEAAKVRAAMQNKLATPARNAERLQKFADKTEMYDTYNPAVQKDRTPEEVRADAAKALAAPIDWKGVIPAEAEDAAKARIGKMMEQKGYKTADQYAQAAQAILNGRRPGQLSPSERLAFDAIAQKAQSLSLEETGGVMRDEQLLGAPRTSLEERKKIADALLADRLEMGDKTLPQGAKYDVRTRQFTVADRTPPSFETLLAEAESAQTPEARKAVMDKFAEIDVPATNLADMLSGKSRRELGMKLMEAMRKSAPRKTPEEIEAEIELLKARATDIPAKTAEAARHNLSTEQLKKLSDEATKRYREKRLSLDQLKELSKEYGFAITPEAMMGEEEGPALNKEQKTIEALKREDIAARNKEIARHNRQVESVNWSKLSLERRKEKSKEMGVQVDSKGMPMKDKDGNYIPTEQKRHSMEQEKLEKQRIEKPGKPSAGRTATPDIADIEKAQKENDEELKKVESVQVGAGRSNKDKRDAKEREIRRLKTRRDKLNDLHMKAKAGQTPTQEPATPTAPTSALGNEGDEWTDGGKTYKVIGGKAVRIK